MERARVLGAVIAGTIAAGALATVPAAGAASGLTWKACPQARTFQCATLTVPLDYDAPQGEQIEVAAIRKLATDRSHRIGSLFFNPGGPGGSGVLSLPTVYAKFPAAARARFDIVSFDPRGIGNSTPLQCFSSPKAEAALTGQLPVGFPVGPQEEALYQSVYRRYAQSCAHNGGAILSHMSTANVARDMDRLRAAVGDRRLSYYGISYGTLLGAEYANLFPSRVRALVLDGNTAPEGWTDADTGRTLGTFLREGSDEGSASALRAFLDRCSAVSTERCAFSAGTVAATRAKYGRLLEDVKARPLTVEGEKITYATVVAVTATSLYYQNASLPDEPSWKALATQLQALWQLASPDDRSTTLPRSSTLALRAMTRTAGLRGFTALPLPEQQLGVVCSESPNPRDPRSYSKQGQLADLGAPVGFGSLWAYLSAPCAYWPVTDADRYAGPFDEETAPVLVVGTRHDPATPYEASLRMASELADTRLLTVSGGGHTALLNTSSCANRATGRYLVSGTLPPTGTVCAQDEAPF